MNATSQLFSVPDRVESRTVDLKRAVRASREGIAGATLPAACCLELLDGAGMAARVSIAPTARSGSGARLGAVPN